MKNNADFGYDWNGGMGNSYIAIPRYNLNGELITSEEYFGVKIGIPAELKPLLEKKNEQLVSQMKYETNISTPLWGRIDNQPSIKVKRIAPYTWIKPSRGLLPGEFTTMEVRPEEMPPRIEDLQLFDPKIHKEPVFVAENNLLYVGTLTEGGKLLESKTLVELLNIKKRQLSLEEAINLDKLFNKNTNSGSMELYSSGSAQLIPTQLTMTSQVQPMTSQVQPVTSQAVATPEKKGISLPLIAGAGVLAYLILS